jgi:MFS family permease
MGVSLLMIAAGFLFRPFITSLWHLYLLSAFVFAGFPGATALPAGKLVSLWFPATKGRTMGAVISGNNFGGVILPSLAATLISFGGWQLGYVVFGAMMVLLSIVTLLIIREDEEIVEREMRISRRPMAQQASRRLMNDGMTLKQALRSHRFWLIVGGLFGAAFTYQGVLTQLRQHFVENDFTAALSTTAITVIAAMGIGSKLAFGRASERWTARICCIVSIALQTTGLFIMSFADSVPVMWVGIIVFGMGFGGLGPLLVLIVQESFGMKEFGSIYGIVQLPITGALALSPALAGWLHDQTGSFDTAFLIIAAVFVTAMACLLAARDHSKDSIVKIYT